MACAFVRPVPTWDRPSPSIHAAHSPAGP